eukprot:comp22302_c0_seq1/m.33101 comp22302_c0_seq1/g.33101  ORF comp22302_c0_seq1/g.33101 comp22302_c0_seq1/m.33101 type:complete len:265 (-) comp22302_c0_seq1:221-1015(-)
MRYYFVCAIAAAAAVDGVFAGPHVRQADPNATAVEEAKARLAEAALVSLNPDGKVRELTPAQKLEAEAKKLDEARKGLERINEVIARRKSEMEARLAKQNDIQQNFETNNNNFVQDQNTRLKALADTYNNETAAAQKLLGDKKALLDKISAEVDKMVSDLQAKKTAAQDIFAKEKTAVEQQLAAKKKTYDEAVAGVKQRYQMLKQASNTEEALVTDSKNLISSEAETMMQRTEEERARFLAQVAESEKAIADIRAHTPALGGGR